jgi:hypothetical protein
MTINDTAPEGASNSTVPVVVDESALGGEKSGSGSEFVIEDRPLDDYGELRVGGHGSYRLLS